ncbi:MAG TPA: TonB-dependent receptor [Bryobacteraceae bacterium]|nr:TonB-dependent receptor [Bryobacteraceae bacterium]HPU72130.1 TonB-dependent receptor [Bryobacteraceae bacterium]
MKTGKGSVCFAIALLILAANAPLWGQIERASITGIVTDGTGAVTPGVSVRARHVATGVSYEGTTNEVGSYTISALPPGEYSVTYSASGFKTLVREGITLTSGQIARIDLTLEVGQLTEQVTVTAEATLLQTETSQTSESVTSQVFSALPLAFSGRGRNMAAFAAAIVPGVRNSDYTMSIQGTPGASAGVLVDGMTNLAGFLPGDFAEASISAEAIQELTVITGTSTAEHGRQSGGTLSFILKSGTNQLHGTGFYTLRNEFLHANDWNNNRLLAADPTNTAFRRPMDRQKNYAGSIGGPVYIPKLYDGRNRTFFYFTAERFLLATVGPGSLSRHVPQPEMWEGDLSRLLQPTVVGVDALGRQVFEGMIYDPTTLRLVGNRYVADPFPGNIIPANRISAVARNFAKVFNEWYQPVNTDLTRNSYTSNQNRMDARNYSLKVDHSFSSNHRLSGYYYKHGFPRHFQENVSEVWSLLDPDLGGPLSRSIRQHRRGYNWNVSYDWIISPTKMNHLKVGLNNNGNAFRSRQIGKHFADEWGIKGVGLGAPDDQVTRPVINLGSSPVVTFQSWNHDANRDEFYRNIIVSDSFSWYRGSHTLKFGFEWNSLRYDSQQFNNTGGTFNFAARTTAIPGESFTSRIGNSFASFLLGEVNSATLGPIFRPITSTAYGAAFIQDSWKVNRRLTLNIGLRWSGNAAHYEKNNEFANFNPNLPDPNFGGIPGAVEYAGSGPGRTGRRTIAPGHWRDFGPTAGLAYQITPRVVMRAGYGISYTPEGFGWTYPWRAGFNETNEAAADSKGIYLPVFNIDDGFPADVKRPPDMDPSYAARFGGRRYHPDYTISGYVQNFNFGFQSEVAQDLRIDLEWRGSVGTRLHAGGNVIPNQIHPDELSRGAVLTQTISSPEQAAAAGLPYPYPGFVGLGAYTLLPFPQLQGRSLSAYGDPVGSSTYHSLNLIVTKRMSKGYHIYGAYTFSKNISNVGNVANGGSGGGIQNTYNRSADKAVTSNDRTHVLKAVMTWDLPIGRNRALLANAHPILNAIVGGWNISALLNYASGTPLGHPNSRVTPNFWNGPAIYANFNTPPGGFKRVFDPDKFNPWDANDPGNRFFDPTAFSDAAPQSLGNSPNRFPQVRGLWNWSEDATLMKSFSLKERARLMFRLELFNLFNRHYIGGPNMNMNNSYFGNVTAASGRRTGQLSARIEW